MGIFRPGAPGLNCVRCGVDLHGEREVEQGLCARCAEPGVRSRDEGRITGERWIHDLLGDVRAAPEDVARDALLAPKQDLPAEVARAVEALLRWRLETPSERDDRA